MSTATAGAHDTGVPSSSTSTNPCPPTHHPPLPTRVQGALLQSPLVTSWGSVVIVTDQLAVYQYPDPATVVAGPTGVQTWAPTAGPFTPNNQFPATAIVEDTVYGGAIIDSNDILYMVDQRNRAIRAVQLLAGAPFFGELPNSPYWFNRSIPFGLPETASMLIIPQTAPVAVDQLWIPLVGSLEGTAGLAVVVATSYFSNGAYPPFFAPLPNYDCKWPFDYGSAALPATPVTEGNAAAFFLSEQSCGAVAMTADVTTQAVTKQYYTEPASYSFSAEGEHSHPLYDTTTDSLVWIDYSVRYGMPQQLCCAKLGSGFGSCTGWSGQCVNIPAEAFDPDSETFAAWEWMALGAANGNLYIVASGYDSITSTAMHSGIFVYPFNGGGKLGAKYRVDGDMYNSAPLLVVSPGNLGGATRLILTTTLGRVVAFDAANVAAGPVWTTSGEVAAIPNEDLPQSTYSFLTLTPSGSLLVTASVGGADWADEKAVYAIVNGVLTPPAPSSGPSNSVVGVALSITAVLVAAAGFGFAYYKAPGFRRTVDSVASSAKNAITGGRSSYKSAQVQSFTGSGGGASGAGGAGDSASAFTGSSGGFNSGGYGGV